MLGFGTRSRGPGLWSSTPFLATRGYVQAAGGQEESARRVLEELDRRRQTENVWRFAIGMMHAGLGEKDLAFATLDEAVRERVGWITYPGVEPGADSLRGDPRFGELLEKARVP